MNKKIGLMMNLRPGDDVLQKFQELKDMGFDCCQLQCRDRKEENREMADKVLSAMEKTGVEVSAYWAGWDGPHFWNFMQGPATLGIVPAAYRCMRVESLANSSRFTKMIGVDSMITHVGFIPEDPHSEVFNDVVAALKYLGGICKENGQWFLFETGQETPVTLLRTIEDVGTGNMGINLDTGNLLLYGKANPLDSLDVFGQYVRNTHLKDGFYPTNGRELGKEAPFGEGKADFPRIMKRLVEIGYEGPWVIENEIRGDKQLDQIITARDRIRKILNDIESGVI